MSRETGQIIDFRRLPADLQSKIFSLGRPGEDRFAFFNRVSMIYLIPVVLAFAWLIYVYAATSQPLWEDWMYYLVCAISMIVFPLAFFAAVKLISPFFSKLKSGYIFTKDDFFKIRGGRIEVWNLKELYSFRFKKVDSEIELWIGDREVRFGTTQTDDAEKLNDLFDLWRNNAGEGIGADLRDPKFSFKEINRLAVLGGSLLVLMFIGFWVGQIFAGMNRQFDDRQTWARAEQADSIEEFENYIARHPNGNFSSTADQKIGERVGRVKDDYLASAATGSDPEAVNAMASVFEQAAKRPDRTVFIRVAETRELDTSIVTTLEKSFGFTMNGYDVSVPASGGGFRKNKVFSDIRIILTNSSNRGAVRFALAETLPDDVPVIDVNLLIKSERIFFRVNSFGEGRMQTSNYPGASFLFRVDLKSGPPAPVYHMEYVGQPLRLYSGVFDRRDKDNYSFDKLYFSTVTEEFDRTFEKTFGFARKADDTD